MKTLIVGGGTIEDDFAREYIDRWKPDYVIAADRGMEFCYRAGQIPDCIIGDYDSVRPEVYHYFREKSGIERHSYPAEKDDTDSGLAVELAIEKKSSAIHMIGMTGTRIDHMLGNIQLLRRILEQGIEGRILDSHNRIRLVQGTETLQKEDAFGSYVSLLPLTETLEGVTLTGFKYSLKDAVMRGGNTLGISNELVEESACIVVQKGIGIVIESRD